MTSMFIVPTLVSDTVNDRFVPLLSKLVERNIAVNYRNVFHQAVNMLKLKEEVEGVTVLDAEREVFLLDEEDIIQEVLGIESSDVRDARDNIAALKEKIDKAEGELATLEKNKASKGDIEDKKDEIKQYKAEIRQEEKRIDRIKTGKKPRPISISISGKKNKNKPSKTDKKKDKREEKKDKREEEKEKRVEMEKGRKTGTASVDSVDVPAGMVFYKDIGLEPTMIEFPVKGELFTIGIKCIPYKLKNPENLLLVMMQHGQGGFKGAVRRFFESNKNRILRNMWGKAGHIRRGRPTGGITAVGGGWRTPLPGEEPLSDIVFAPSIYELSRPRYIYKNLMTPGAVSSWSSAVVITTEDVESSGIDLEHFFKIYKRLTKIGWGDIIIIDVSQESIHYCSLAFLSCTKIPFSYLQKLLNLDNVLDFSELNKYSKGPFSKVPSRSFAKKFDRRKQ